MATGEKTDGELFDDQFLADDCFSELRAKGLVGFSEFIDGSDVIGWELIIKVGRGFHGR